MHLLSLHVENFGLFRGPHPFDLAPTDAARKMTLFVGHNGAGKSTLFRALAVALHGRLALGDRVTQDQYGEFLYNRLHRRKEGEKNATSENASVGLSFEYVQSGVPRRVHVSRRWRRSGRTVEETLSVTQDGQALAEEAADAQAWLNELVPPGVARLCFFDAEDLDALAGADQRNPQLGAAMQRLLGLDMIQRLQADLRAYTLREGGDSTISALRGAVLAHQATLEGLERRLAVLREREAVLAEDEATHRANLLEQERRLAAAGGLYAARRALQQERVEAVQREIQAAEAQMGELAAHLLPFTLAPKLCRRLSARLTEEAETQRRQIAQTLVGERLSEIAAAVSAADFLGGLRLSQERQQVIRGRIQEVLQSHGPADDAEAVLLHHLAAPEREQLQAWIPQVLATVPEQVQEIGERLRRLQDERRTIDLDLQRAPEDEDLAPLHTGLLQLQLALTGTRALQAALQEEIGALQFQRDNEDRQMQRAIERLTDAQATEQDLVLAARSRSALRAFEDALTRQRLIALERSLVQCFNVLCQKEHLLSAVSIDPGDFAVRLESADGRILSLGSFSAGERQLYALALLQAMRQVSGHELPLLIDTPLARLDEQHRQRLLHDYLPVIGDQVLLFATDAEMGADLQAQAEPYLAQTYRLRFDAVRRETRLIDGEQIQDVSESLDDTKEFMYAF